MVLVHPWMLAVAAGLIVIAIVVGILLGRRRARHRESADTVGVARAERLRALPSFQANVRRRKAGLSAVLALSILAIGVTGVVAARPQAEQTIQPENANRDIMLCLDVSGSMSEVDIEVLAVFRELLDGFKGERIGLTIFNSSPVQVFPLTDDYAFISGHLDSLIESFDYVDEVPEHWLGTLNGNGSSLVGDGLAACALRFDHPDEERARSIILATDNEVIGAPIVSLEQAAGYAASLGVRVFALDPIQDESNELSQQLSAAAQATGGQSFGLRATTTVSDIVSEVKEQDATRLRGEAQIVRYDKPQMWMVLALVLALSSVLVVWRVRL